MSVAQHHAEWLWLVEASGPFISMPVLMRAFPQGLDSRDSQKASVLRAAYEDWAERGEHEAALHRAWVQLVLTSLLEFPSALLVEGQSIPPGLEAAMPQFGEVLRPTFALKHRDSDSKPPLLITLYPPGQSLEAPVSGTIWKASPGTRMMELLHVLDCSLGLATNGEQWMLVYAPRGETTGFASWYADLWFQEPITLRAFTSLLHARRFFGVAADDTLPALLKESSKDQQEVTDQLGYQVRQAVEVLVQALDRIDDESGRTLLVGVEETKLYDAALTVMMRLVFLFAAEERGLLLLGDPLYDQYYAVSTLRDILRERADQHGEEVLERRNDAWCRLLATFRAVHSGIEHEAMHLPAYGGTLFHPDRFPFLEGRPIGTTWTTDPAKPLPINNRVVLHLLEALQVLRVKVAGGGPAEARRISFRSLDIEQIGHVYEGLLDHTARRATELVLGLAGTREKEQEITLSDLEKLKTAGVDSLIQFLNEVTGRSKKALQKAIESVDFLDAQKLFIACGQDARLEQRVKPFANLLREDSFGQLVVISEDSVYVTRGSDRRSTGTHYTPRSLTEPIVQYALEPLVYIGPTQGKPQSEWQLKSPKEILGLKVCDLAMGSGAFLVQACRYLSERLVEAWERLENEHPGQQVVTPEGGFSAGDPEERLLPSDAAECLALARRYVANRCLYGVDINPMAVEMAKLSLWLVTLQKDRPFTFLDHALKCGDSLLGVSKLEQIKNFGMREGPLQHTFSTISLFKYVEEAAKLRQTLESLPSETHEQLVQKQRLHAEAEAATAKVKNIADLLIALELRPLDGSAYKHARESEAERVQALLERDSHSAQESIASNVASQLGRAIADVRRTRRPFHWPLEFPEVVSHGGFDAFVGNPPFLGGSKISGALGEDYRTCILRTVSRGKRGNADLCAYFFLRVAELLATNAYSGLVATNTIAQGDTRDVGLNHLTASGISIYRALPSIRWPGLANLEVAHVWMTNSQWKGAVFLEDREVREITSFLDIRAETAGIPYDLMTNSGKAFSGNKVYGEGFVLNPQVASELIRKDPKNAQVLFPYARADDINGDPRQTVGAWVINFGTRSLEESEAFPDVMEMVRTRVKPYRDNVKNSKTRENWWIHERLRPELYSAIRSLRRVLFHGFTCKYLCFTFLPTNIVFAAPHVILAFDGDDVFGLLQSTVHEVWVRRYASTLETRMRYPVSDVFENFPFPDLSEKLIKVGALYYRHRSETMLQRSLGLTDLYNCFHDPHICGNDIEQLRALHREMDQIVCAAYGWTDLDLDHGFYETKQGLRYTITEPARQSLLDRLLALNHHLHAKEVKWASIQKR